MLSRRPSLLLVASTVLILAGCSSTDISTIRSANVSSGGITSGPVADTECDDPSVERVVNGTERPAHLESALVDLVAADNRTAYAGDRQLTLRNDSVEVTFELEAGAGVPSGFDVSVVTSYEHLVQAFVPVCQLVPLSEHGNVSYIRSPRQAIPEPSSTGDPEP